MAQLKKFLGPIILLVAGIVFVVLGSVSLKQVKTFPQVQAVVTNVETRIVETEDGTDKDITAYVKYTIDGVEYNEILQNAPGNISENDEITVRYNPEKPTYVTGATKGSGTIQIAIGAVAAVAGLAALAVTFIKGR